ncbi:hypothetical protein CTM53_11535 [Prevotella intermedia]|uniref:T6SS Phospholipase effector Tle1-like catalytic domain-containing protein n=1 Tax=Prevotella intermedia TaxID=28131 RepID=A0AAJ3VCZ4_PREIN|nr:DUF2235 domain-containing protein [Prevotella intermedia]ATV55628.1 hypothetical protein CTM61_09490 [Prevotella intermedia]PJI19181.1 hypothetical protein CTM53_11535 [Prevotella intermedia]
MIIMGEFTNRLCVVGLPSSDNKAEEATIDLTIGVSFDGTLNNKYNTQWASTESIDDSYRNAYTNVVKLWRYYNCNNKDSFKVYIEGPGTVSPLLISRNDPSSEQYKKEQKHLDKDEDGTWVSSQKSDKLKGAGLGMSDTGVNAKIERACWLITRVVSKVCQGEKKLLKNLTLDVYGFSRGAASARSFISTIYSLNKEREKNSEDFQVSLSQWLSMYDFYTKKTNITIRFLGLFDTVSSYGYNFNDDVNDLQLRIPTFSPCVKRVIHLVAADEYRKNFSLTDISSAGNRGREIILPGAHSDIGGGYRDIEEEKMYDTLPRNMRYREYFDGKLECRGYMSYDKLVSEGWLPIGWNQPIHSLDRFGHSCTEYRKTRKVRNDYARIPCYVMYQLSTNQPYKPVIEGKCSIGRNDLQLRALKDLIISKVKANQSLYKWETNQNGERTVKFVGNDDEKELIKKIRYEFIHLSAYNSGISTLWANKAAKNNKRKIINDTI